MISASGGQGRGVVWVATLQRGGGSPRWLTRWPTLLTTTTLLSQRAPPSLVWSGPCLESLIGHGLARIPRVGCDNRGGAAPGVSPPRPARRGAAREGEEVEGATPPFWPLVRHRAGGGGAPLWSHHLPSPAGVAPSTVIPAGRKSSRPGSRLEEQQTTDGPQAERDSTSRRSLLQRSTTVSAWKPLPPVF